MKYVKMLGLLAVAVAALMAFAASASATTLTDETNDLTPYAGTIHATAGLTTLHGAATIECHESTVHGHVTNAGGPSHGETVSGSITSLTFGNCTKGNHVTVNNPGTLEIHTDNTEINDGNGTLTSTGAEVTIEITTLGITCIFTTNGTDVGTLDGSRKTVNGKHPTAVLTINSANIPRTGGSIFCGSSGKWTGEYTITTPDYLDVD